MLTKLLPDQIAKHWPIIKYAIENSLPPIVGDSPDRMNRILASALSDKVDIWAGYIRVGGQIKLEGIAVTKLLYDEVSDTRNLLLYCIYSYNQVSSKSWMEDLLTLVQYAKGKKCSFINAYSDLPQVIHLANRLGADSRYTFLSFEVNKIVQKLNELGR